MTRALAFVALAALSGCISDRILVAGQDGSTVVSRPAFSQVERSTELERRRLAERG